MTDAWTPRPTPRRMYTTDDLVRFTRMTQATLNPTPRPTADEDTPPAGLTEEQQAIWRRDREAMRAEVARIEARDLKRLMSLPKVPIRFGTPDRIVTQPVFKPEFEEVRDAQMRLNGTLVYIGPDLYYVQTIVKDGDDMLMSVSDEDGGMYRVPYSHPSLDLRTPEPQYVNTRAYGPAWVYRVPSRQQKQGLASGNLQAQEVGSQKTIRSPSMTDIIAAFKRSDILQWSNTYEKLLQCRAINSLRLSPRVSVYFDNEEKSLFSEYKGRPLGPVKDDVVLVKENDVKPWITNDLRRAGLTCKEGSSAL